jgi:hypothetical protein
LRLTPSTAKVSPKRTRKSAISSSGALIGHLRI